MATSHGSCLGVLWFNGTLKSNKAAKNLPFHSSLNYTDSKNSNQGKNMPYFEPCKGEITQDQMDTVDKIKTLAAGATLGDIEKNLCSVEAPWFVEFDFKRVRSISCLLYALEQVQNYSADDKGTDGSGSEKMEQIVGLMSYIFQNQNKEPLSHIKPLLDQIEAWLDRTPKTDKELALCKTFLIFSKTSSLRLNSLNFTQSAFLGANLKSEVITRLNQISEKAKKQIIAIAPAEAIKSIEDHLSAQLPENPYTVKNKVTRNQQFTGIDEKLLKQENEFKQLHALRSMQTLFKTNQEKITGREYFSSLTGVISDGSLSKIQCLQRMGWVDIILAGCDDETKVDWTNRLKKITDPSANEVWEKQQAAIVSTLSTAPTVAARWLWGQSIVQAVLQSSVVESTMKIGVVQSFIEKVTDFTATNDSLNKEAFCKLLEQQADIISGNIACSNSELKDLLMSEPIKKINELEIKTGLIRQLYQQDQKLADFIHENRTLSIRLLYFLTKHTPLNFNSPIMSLILVAEGYQKAVGTLRDEVLIGTDLNKRLDTMVEKISKLENDAKLERGRSLVVKLANFKSNVPGKATMKEDNTGDLDGSVTKSPTG